MRAPADIGTGTFGKLAHITDTQADDLHRENIALKQELRQLKDQLKSVIGTLGNFQIKVHDKFNKLDLEMQDLRK